MMPGKAMHAQHSLMYSAGWEFPNDVIVVSTWGCVFYAEYSFLRHLNVGG